MTSHKIFSWALSVDVHMPQADKHIILNDLDQVKRICYDALDFAKCHRITETWHQFSPKENLGHSIGGITGCIILSESHFHISTWPEEDYFQIDINTCGGKGQPFEVLKHLALNLDIEHMEIRSIKRG